MSASSYVYKNPDAHAAFGRAQALMYINSDSPATADYETPAGLFQDVLRLEPDCADPYVFAGLGQALLRLKRGDAIGHLERALRLNEESGILDANRAFLAMTYRDLGLAEFQKGKTRYARAQGYFREALAITPTYEAGLASILSQIQNELQTGSTTADASGDGPTPTTDERPVVWRSVRGEHAFRAQVDLSLKYPGKERVAAGTNAIGCLKCNTATPLTPCSNCGGSGYDFGLSTDRVIGLFCSRCRRGFTSVRCNQCGTQNPITHETLLDRGTESKGACFIATAVLDGQYTEQLAALCNFRDQVLMSSVLGATVVRAYYRLSPSFAACLEKSPVAKMIVRRCVVLPMARAVTARWLRQ